MSRAAPVSRDDRVVLIFGASSGIGEASAEAFARRGARLVLASRTVARLEPVQQRCDELGAGGTTTFAVDVNDEETVQRCVDHAIDTYGAVDVVVHSAAVMGYGSIEAVPSDVFAQVVDTSVHGTANVARAVLPAFRSRGRGTLIVVNSLLGQIPVPMMGAYITAKWGQLGLLRVLNLETRSEPNIHVCTVSPGSVDTPIFGIAANYAGWAGRPPPPVSSPQKLAKAVLRLADRPRKDTSVGPGNRVIKLGYRLLPPVFDRLVTPLVKFGVLTTEPAPPTEGNVFTPAPGSPLDDKELTSAARR